MDTIVFNMKLVRQTCPKEARVIEARIKELVLDVLALRDGEGLVFGGVSYTEPLK